MIVSRNEHPLKANSPIEVTSSGITRFVKPEQNVNAPSPIVFRDFGKLISVIRPHLKKAFLSILVIVSGRIILVTLLQSAKH